MFIISWLLRYPLSIAISLGAGFLMANAVGRLLTRRKAKILKIAPAVIFWIAVQMPSWIGDENPLIMLPFFLGVFYLCYVGQPLARFVTGVTLYTLILPLNMMLDTARRWGLVWDDESILTVLVKCGLYLLIWLMIRQLTRDGKPLKLRNRLWAICGLLVLSPFIASMSFSIWNSFSRGSMDDAQLRLAYTILPFSMLSAAALLVALTVLSHHEELERSARLTEMRELYYEGLQSKQAQVQMLRHDLRNHLTVLQGLLEQGNSARATEYLAELTASPALHGTKRICENEIANVVLTGKLEAMEQQGLLTDVLVTLPVSLHVADSDLCALLGNALDNAMEAAAKTDDKQITVRARADRGMLMLRVENDFGEKPTVKQNVFFSTKTDTDTHGFGIQGMREIAERYGGTLETNVADSRFELVACLPLKG